MPAQSTYAYRARDGHGNIVTGSLVASSTREVSTKLRAEGKYVLSVSDHALRAEQSLDENQVLRNEMAKRVSREDVIAFCQQLSVMLDTGVPLAEALDAFCKQVVKKEFRQVLESIRDDIHSGEPFSVAMSRWPRIFPTMMVSLMKASEASGTLAAMLNRIGTYLAKERRTVKQIKGALGYPIFMMSIAVVMTIILMAFVLPRFASIYEMRSAALPTPTLILLSASEFITTKYMYYLPALIIGGVATFFWSRTRAGRRSFDWFRLNCPVIRVMYRQLYVTRMARTMGTLLAAGVSLLDIIDLCRGVTNNAYYDDLWDEVAANIRDGHQLSDAFVGCKFVPPNVISMIAAGERSSRLAEVMDRIAEFSEEELDTAVKQTTSYIEPTMIVVMGIVVGSIALALLLPIFSMGHVMTGSS